MAKTSNSTSKKGTNRLSSDLGYWFIDASEWRSSGVEFPGEWEAERVILPWESGYDSVLGCLWSGYSGDRFVRLYTLRSWLWHAVFPGYPGGCRERRIRRRWMPSVLCYDYIRWPPWDWRELLRVYRGLELRNQFDLRSLPFTELEREAGRRLITSDLLMAETFEELMERSGRSLSYSASRLVRAWTLGFRYSLPVDEYGRILSRRSYADRIVEARSWELRRGAGKRRVEAQPLACDGS